MRRRDIHWMTKDGQNVYRSKQSGGPCLLLTVEKEEILYPTIYNTLISHNPPANDKPPVWPIFSPLFVFSFFFVQDLD